MKTNPETKRRGLSLWLPVTLAFLLLIAAWTTLIIIANRNPSEYVAVETSDTQ